MSDTPMPSSSSNTVKEYDDEEPKKSKPKGKKPMRKPMNKSKDSWHGF